MAEHRVSLLRSALRRRVDPARSRDPHVQAVVGALATLPIAPPPDPAFRAELRAQLVAIAPRIVAESAPATTGRAGATTTAPATAVSAPAAGNGVSKRRFALGRPLAITASLVTVLALLLGGAVWMSRKALPGDTLYGLKRASESLQLATAGGDRDKAQDYLDFAATRAGEVRDLLAAHQTAQIAGTLKSADGDVTAAARLLNAEAVRTASKAPLQTMNGWAPGQLDRLRALVKALPAGALKSRANASVALVTQAQQRSRQLAGKLGCTCLRGGVTDKFGPLPCAPCTKPAGTSTPSRPGTRGTTTTAPTHRKAPVGGTTGRNGRQVTATRGNAPPSASRPGGGASTPGVPNGPVNLPGGHTPSLHVPGRTVGKCGVSVSVGGVVLKVDCSPGVHVSLPK